MTTETVQAWAALVAAAAGVVAIVTSFVLEGRRRSDAKRDRLIEARRSACVDLLAATSEIARASAAFMFNSGLAPDNTPWVLPSANAANRASTDLELAAPRVLPEAKALYQAAVGMVAAANKLASAPRDQLRRRSAADAETAWNGARAAFVRAALEELGTID